MKRLTKHSLLLLLLLALIGCKKSAPESDQANEEAAQETVEEIDEGPVDTSPLKAEFDAELLYSFEGVLGAGDKRRPEDNTPVENHEAELEEGDYIYVEMQAHDPFRTYLMIAPPNQAGGYQNGECYPGQGLSSCIRFQAGQTGTYVFMANAAAARSYGAYTLNIYKETEEQAKANAAAHAIVAKQSQERLDQHLRIRKAQRQKRLQERKQARERARKAREEKAADDTPDADDEGDVPNVEDGAPAQEDLTP